MKPTNQAPAALPSHRLLPVQEAQVAALLAQLRMPLADAKARLQRQARAKERSETQVGWRAGAGVQRHRLV